MSFDREQYNKDQRIVSYVDKEVKESLTEAVNKKLSSSVSKLSSDIIRENFKKHIRGLEEDANTAASRSAD